MNRKAGRRKRVEEEGMDQEKPAEKAGRGKRRGGGGRGRGRGGGEGRGGKERWRRRGGGGARRRKTGVKEGSRKGWKSKKWCRWKSEYGGIRGINEEEGLEEAGVEAEEENVGGR